MVGGAGRVVGRVGPEFWLEFTRPCVDRATAKEKSETEAPWPRRGDRGGVCWVACICREGTGHSGQAPGGR